MHIPSSLSLQLHLLFIISDRTDPVGAVYLGRQQWTPVDVLGERLEPHVVLGRRGGSQGMKRNSDIFDIFESFDKKKHILALGVGLVCCGRE